MKKKINAQKLVLNKIRIARLTDKQQEHLIGGQRISDPLTENPCDPTPSMLNCSRRTFCC